MTTDPRLEAYLSSLERALRPFSVSDRADIITEIKSHVIAALEKDPQTRLETTLEALGEPEVVANRYLLERGLKPTKPPISPAVKWIVIGFLASFSMIFIFAGLIAFKAMNFVFNGDFEHGASHMANVFDLDSTSGSLIINGKHFNWGHNSHKIDGKAPSRPEFAVNFSNGKMNLATSDNGEISWECKLANTDDLQTQPTVTDKRVSLDLTKTSGSKCDIRVPKGIKLLLQGANGKLEFEEPLFNIDSKLANGVVRFYPSAQGKYNYDLKLTNGRIPTVQNSNDPQAYVIKVEISNGSIKVQD